MNAASHMPSGVLISTFFSTTCCAATSEPAAAARPAATVIVTKSRRVSSSFDMFLVLTFDPIHFFGALKDRLFEKNVSSLHLDRLDEAIGVVLLVSLERVRHAELGEDPIHLLHLPVGNRQAVLRTCATQILHPGC